MLWLDLMGSVEGRLPNGRLGVTARLAASQPPGLFVGYQFLSSLHRDAESPGLGKDLEIIFLKNSMTILKEAGYHCE